MFENLGYFKEYYVDGKFTGTVKSEKDREVIGYSGRRIETTTEEIILDNGKKIKKGTEVKTFLYPLNGKLIK